MNKDYKYYQKIIQDIIDKIHEREMYYYSLRNEEVAKGDIEQVQALNDILYGITQCYVIVGNVLADNLKVGDEENENRE